MTLLRLLGLFDTVATGSTGSTGTLTLALTLTLTQAAQEDTHTVWVSAAAAAAAEGAGARRWETDRRDAADSWAPARATTKKHHRIGVGAGAKME